MALQMTPRDKNVVAKKHDDRLETIAVGRVKIALYRSLALTLEEAKRRLDWQDMLQRYREISKDERLLVSTYRVQNCVIGWIQLQWYELMEELEGQAIPPRVIAQQEQRLREAVVAEATETQEKTKPAKEKKPRIRAIIEQGLLSGKSDEEMLAEIKQYHPDAKAVTDFAKHKAYYVHFLVKAGKMTKPEKPVKVKAEKAEDGNGVAAKKGTKRSADAMKEAAAANESAEEGEGEDEGEAEEAPAKVKAGPAGRRQLADQAAKGNIKRR